MSNFDIRELRKNQADKYAKIKEQEKIEDKKREIEIENNILQEIIYKQEFENFINNLNNIIINVQNCNDITEISLYIETFKEQLDKNIKFVNTDYCKDEISEKVMSLIQNINKNPNSKFDITVKNSSTNAAENITNHIKNIMKEAMKLV